MRKNRQMGFTLIEAMIVVVIVSILAMVAYPSYQDYIRRTRRADCAGVLMKAASVLEQRHLIPGYYSYKGRATPAPAIPDFPPGLSTCPAEGGTTYYNVTLPTLSENEFKLVATPAGTQASDKCGKLTLTHTGTKGVEGGTITAVADCWR